MRRQLTRTVHNRRPTHPPDLGRTSDITDGDIPVGITIGIDNTTATPRGMAGAESMTTTPLEIAEAVILAGELDAYTNTAEAIPLAIPLGGAHRYRG